MVQFLDRPIPAPLWNTIPPEAQAAILALVASREQRIADLETEESDLRRRLAQENQVRFIQHGIEVVRAKLRGERLPLPLAAAPETSSPLEAIRRPRARHPVDPSRPARPSFPRQPDGVTMIARAGHGVTVTRNLA